jgi:O-antigen/teichoic acid export membrane protein
MTQNLDVRRFASDAGINLIRVSVMTLLGIGISIALARGLGTEGKGFYEIAIFLPNFLYAILSIGAYPAISFWISFTGIAVGIVAIVIGGELFFPNVPRHLLFLSLFLLPFLHSRQNLSGIFQGKSDFRAFSMIELIPYVVNFVILALAIWWFPDREAIGIIAVILGNLLASVFALYHLSRYTNGQSVLTLSISRSYLIDTLKYGLKTQLGLIMLFFLFRVDVYLINQVGGGPSSVGIYSIAVILAERVWVFTGFATQVMLPRIASWTNEDEKRTQLTLMTTRFTIWLSLVIGGLVLVFGKFLIELLYGSSFTPAVNALFLILPGIVMYNFSRVLGTDMSGRGKPEINSILFTVSLFINVVANLILIPRFDYLGAAISSSIAYSILGVATLIIFCRMYHVSWTQMFLLEREDRTRISSLVKYVRTRFDHSQA